MFIEYLKLFFYVYFMLIDVYVCAYVCLPLVACSSQQGASDSQELELKAVINLPDMSTKN